MDSTLLRKNTLIAFICLCATIMGSTLAAQEIIDKNVVRLKSSEGKTIKAIDFQVMFNDSTYEVQRYVSDGRCVEIRGYKDLAFQTLHGLYCAYNEDGWIDSCGWFVNGLKNGQWYKRVSEDVYEIGVFNSGEPDTAFSKVKVLSKVDSVVERKEIIPAVFSKGRRSLKEYILSMAQASSYIPVKPIPIIISFVIDKSGTPQQVFIMESANYSLDSLFRRILMEMPAWSPAVDKKSGLPVAAHYYLPIVWAPPQK